MPGRIMLEPQTQTYPFLSDGGEMGALTRSFNWNETVVGVVDQWPQSLRTTVGIILHSDFPMFLWWGEEMIQFYNDAYRPSLGDHGKHPTALGQRGEECWPEIWDIIFPLIQNVKNTGESFFSEDQLIPIYRNGRIEDVYWTFSYSPVIGDTGNIDGVLVVCNETTQKVNMLNEIRLAEGKLKERESNLKNVILQAPVAMCIFKGRNYVVEIANERMFEFWGRSKQEILDKPIFNAMPEAREQGFEKLLDDVYLSGKSFKSLAHPVKLRRNGKMENLYVDFVYEAFHDDDGTISGIITVATDVTEQIRSAKRNEETENRYKTLLTESTVAIAFYLGRELRIQYVNEIMTGYWGKDLSVIGKTFPEAVPELEGQPFFKLLDDVFTTGNSYLGTEEEAILRRGDRFESFYFNFIYKALRNSDGEVYAIHHMAMDVTEQVVARKKLAQSESNLRNIIIQSPVAMCLLKTKQLVVEIANERMLEIWGKKLEEVLDKPLFEGLSEARSQGFEDVLDSVYETGKRFIADERPVNLLRKGRLETKYVNFVYEAFYESERVAGVMAVAIEVTDQVLARQKIEEVVTERTKELAESNASLQRSNEELAQFAYIASHDLQEPARKISTFADLLKRNLEIADPKSKSYLGKIENSSARMLALIRDVLSFSQLSKREHSPARVDLNEIAGAVLSDFDLLIEEKAATITVDKLPVVNGIKVQMRQLFTNLISNALKFTQPGIPPAIAIVCEFVSTADQKQDGRMNQKFPLWKLSFVDNGIGFNQHNANQIFDIFQRLHGKDDFAGTGIGLAICKKIVQNHKGEIFAESQPGKGATFHIFLPLNQELA